MYKSPKYKSLLRLSNGMLVVGFLIMFFDGSLVISIVLMTLALCFYLYRSKKIPTETFEAVVLNKHKSEWLKYGGRGEHGVTFMFSNKKTLTDWIDVYTYDSIEEGDVVNLKLQDGEVHSLCIVRKSFSANQSQKHSNNANTANSKPSKLEDKKT